MKRMTISLAGRSIVLNYPETLDREMTGLFARLRVPEDMPVQSEPTAPDIAASDLSVKWPGTPGGLTEELPHLFAETAPEATLLRAGAVSIGGRAVLIAGRPGGGKTALVAWFVNQGFSYCGDNAVVLGEASASVSGLDLPLAVYDDIVEMVLALPAFADAHVSRAAGRKLIQPGPGKDGAISEQPCGLIILPRFMKNAGLNIEPLEPVRLRRALGQPNYQISPATPDGQRRIAALCEKVPAIAIRYGHFDQLRGIADELARFVLAREFDAREFRSYLEGAGKIEAPSGVSRTYTIERATAVPAATVRRYRKRLTIGMATYDDYDGVYFTIQALRLYHPEAASDIEFLVIDNHPDGPCAEALKNLEAPVGSYRYVPLGYRTGTAVRDHLMEEASSRFVMCLDCHVLVVPGAIKRLIDYCEARPDSSDLLQGPLLFDDLRTLATHFYPEWRGGMYGHWALDKAGEDPEAAPFDIPMQGLGLYACRRAAWPGFNIAFRGFGGEEGYIHEKFRRASGRTLCLPFLRWVHRFNRPMGIPYQPNWEDRIRNYMIGHRELGLPTDELEKHFHGHVGAELAGRIIERTRRELDRL